MANGAHSRELPLGPLPLPAQGDVDLWHFDLDAARESLHAVLSAEESSRAAAMRFPEHQRRAANSRALLRTVLGAYLRIEPSRVAFQYGPQGKPQVDGIAFNLSHCGCKALLAIAANGRIGADIELSRAERDLMGLAERFYCPEELSALLQAPEAMRGEMFHTFWVRKEAMLKACGGGLTLPLKQYSALSCGLVGSWWLCDVDSWPHHVAAVASDQPIAVVRHFMVR